MKKFLSMTGVAIAGAALILSSCVNTDYTPPDYDALLESDLAAVDKTQLAADLVEIDDSLQNWDLADQIQIDSKGSVRYRVLEMGTGEMPTLTSYILMSYTGILFDSVKFVGSQYTGTPFDQNLAPDTYYPLYNLIVGFRTVLQQLPEGTRVQMFIPSGMGYGIYGVTNTTTGEVLIPANANLFFDVTIEDVSTQ